MGASAALLLRSQLTGQQDVSLAGSGLVDVSLTAASTWLSVASRQALLYSYDGQVPGPLIEARAGDTVRLRLKNELPEPTNLHYHGLHVPPTGHADNSFLEIPPGETLMYEFTLPAGHPAGTFWYHPHVHGLVARQVSRGLAGAFVVRGELDATPEIRDTPEHFLVLQDFDLYADGLVREPRFMERMQGREGPLVTLSAERNPRISIQQGGWVRLRIVNASSSRFYRLRLEEHPLHLIATDGGAVPSPIGVEEILLVPGERTDVLVQGQRGDGDYLLLNLPYN
ncbi:MAG: multicopper oxidase domain-containing protein, partial [Bryobacterales bacterium]|nr:multicopper oxidase domain-containing protein [Bryobacterales bacterium]